MSKLKKLKNDLKLIHFVDGKEIICSFNACLKKFETGSHYLTRHPNWNNKKPITSETFFWYCKECGAKVNGPRDQNKSYHSYMSAICNYGEPPKESK